MLTSRFPTGPGYSRTPSISSVEINRVVRLAFNLASRRLITLILPFRPALQGHQMSERDKDSRAVSTPGPPSQSHASIVVGLTPSVVAITLSSDRYLAVCRSHEQQTLNTPAKHQPSSPSIRPNTGQARNLQHQSSRIYTHDLHKIHNRRRCQGKQRERRSHSCDEFCRVIQSNIRKNGYCRVLR